MQVTSDCNQNCVYCTRSRESREPSLQELKSKIKSFDNVDQIIITGGEPLLRSDIFEIIQEAKKKAKVHLQTNGTLITSGVARKLEKSGLDSILVHLPTLDKFLFSFLSRSSPKLLQQKFDALESLAKTNIKTGVVFVVNSLNYSELFEIAKKIFSISYKFYLQITNTIRFSQDVNEVIPLAAPLNLFKPILNKTLQFCENNHLEVRIDGIPLCFIDEKFFKYVSDLKVRTYDFDQKFIRGEKKYDSENYEGKEHVYLEHCKSCELKNLCKGFYIYYKKYYELKKLPEGPHEMPRIDVRTGYLCNNNCLYCCVGHLGEKLKSTKDILIDLFEGRKAGAMKVSFTGGEPTIRKDIFFITKAARDMGYYEVQVITNGRMLSYPKFFDNLVESGVNRIAFSFDDVDQKIVDTLSSVKGTFEQLMRAFENAKKYTKVHYTTITVINKLNYKHLSEIVKFLIKLNKSLPKMSSEFMFISPEGNALNHIELLIPKIREVVPYVHEALDIAIKNKYPLNVEAIPLCYMRGYENHVVELHMAEKRFMANLGSLDRDYNASRKNFLKAKPLKCSNCKYFDMCEGVHKEYLKLFGDEELKPVK